jgi:hypothetical protein
MKRLYIIMSGIMIGLSGLFLLPTLSHAGLFDAFDSPRHDDERRIEENTRRRLEEIDRRDRELKENEYRQRMLFEMQEQNRIMRERQYQNLRNEKSRIREILEGED